MEHITYTSKAVNKENEKLLFLKYFLFTYNLLLFMCGCLLLGIGIWLAVDRNFLTTIIGNNLYAAAVFLILAAGAVIFFISFFGCCGAITESFVLLGAFFIILCVASLVCLIGGILAIIFRTQIGDKVRSTMSTTLTDHYGFGFESNTTGRSLMHGTGLKRGCSAVPCLTTAGTCTGRVSGTVTLGRRKGVTLPMKSLTDHMCLSRAVLKIVCGATSIKMSVKNGALAPLAHRLMGPLTVPSITRVVLMLAIHT